MHRAGCPRQGPRTRERGAGREARPIRKSLPCDEEGWAVRHRSESGPVSGRAGLGHWARRVSAYRSDRAGCSPTGIWAKLTARGSPTGGRERGAFGGPRRWVARPNRSFSRLRFASRRTCRRKNRSRPTWIARMGPTIALATRWVWGSARTRRQTRTTRVFRVAARVTFQIAAGHPTIPAR